MIFIPLSDIIQTLSWDTLDARRLLVKSTSMYKILNSNTAPNLRTLLLEGMLIRLITISEIVLQIWHFLHRRESFQREVLNIAAQCFGTNSQIRQNKRNRYIHLINVSKRNLVMSCHIVSQPAPPSRIYGILLLSHTPLTATAEKKILFTAIQVYSRGTAGSTEKRTAFKREGSLFLKALGRSDHLSSLRRKSTTHLKHLIPTRQSCIPVFIVILIFTNGSIN